MAVFKFHGRPCIVTSEQGRRFRQGPRWVKYVAVLLDYLDGQHPASQAVGQGSFKAATVLRGPEGAYWQRVVDLKKLGMDLAEARRHALQEAQNLKVE